MCPIFEFQCPFCLDKVERITFGDIKNTPPICKRCDQGVEMEQIEFSLVAKRNPEYGIR